MLRPMPPRRRLSKKAPAQAEGARGCLPRGRSASVGRGRGQAGPQAADQKGMGSGGSEAHGQGQKALGVDLPLRLRPPYYRRGVLADLAHGKQGTVLDGA